MSEDHAPDGNEDTFTIMIATDNHLGYMERDPVRGNDSLTTFEEILQLAGQFKVDMVLLGGDLFHDNKPSRRVIFSTLELLRRYCMGSRPCALEFLSDSKANFPSNRFGTVNYEDPNLNVSLPVFSIHGNHDDPTGDGNLCSLDLLSVSGMLNYFGKAREVDDITVTPLLLKKGTSRLSIYGLGNVRDERLHRTFRNKKVKLQKPKEFEDEWFNLMVLHQNRVKHGETNYIPETFLDNFIHLVMWGHEHECLIDPEYCEQQQFHIVQPGSSVATALSEGESKPKHVGLLKIRGQEFSLKKIRLKTVRPFIITDIVLSESSTLSKTDPEELIVFLASKVDSMIDQVTDEWKEENREYLEADPNLEMMKPLVRLRVEYSGFTICNVQRFGQQFVNRVANPKDLLLFHRKRKADKPAGSKVTMLNDEAEMPDQLDLRGVEDLVAEFLENQNLEIFPEKMLTEAVREFVDKDEKDAIKDFVTKSLEATRKHLKERVKEVKDDEILLQEIQMEKQLRSETFERQRSRIGDDGLPELPVVKASGSRVKTEEYTEELDDFGTPSSKAPVKFETNESDFGDDFSSHLNKFGVGSAKGKGKAVATVAKSSTTTTRGRGRATATAKSRASPQPSQSDDDDDMSMGSSKTSSTRGRGSAAGATRGRGRGAKSGSEGKTLADIIQQRRESSKNITPSQSFVDLSGDDVPSSKRKIEESETVASYKKPRQKMSFKGDDSGDETPQSHSTAMQQTYMGGSIADRWAKKGGS